MTNREREYANAGFHYCEGIEQSEGPIIVPATGREIRRGKKFGWEYQPWNDNYWIATPDLLEALIKATPPSKRRPPRSV